MTIQLSGYTALLENAVYAKEVGNVKDDNSQIAGIQGVVLLGTFTEPTEDQVVEHLRETAQNTSSFGHLVLPTGVDYMAGKSLLEIAIMKLPEQIRQHLRTAEKDCMTFVRRHTLAEKASPEDAPRYLQTRYGFIPAKFLEQDETTWKKDGSIWFNAVLSHELLRKNGLGERWSMNLLLSDEGLPNRPELEILLKHGTHGSRTLDINRTRYNIESVREVVDALYRAFPTPEQLSQLRDTSAGALEEMSMQPVMALHQLVKEQKANEQAQRLFLANGSPGSPASKKRSN
ncbi:MAG: hypothetical protein AB1668_02965 [Nanoarchaeota archaeon]